MSPAYIIKEARLAPSWLLQQQSHFSIYILETCECPWGTLSLSLPFESTHAQASAHTSDRLMNLNRRGFRCLDSSGKKTKQKKPLTPPQQLTC